MDEQLTLDLQVPVTFEKYTGTCSCGHKWEYKRCSIVLEMHARCPECSSVIIVGGKK